MLLGEGDEFLQLLARLHHLAEAGLHLVALLGAGLRITSLREYPFLYFSWFPWMVRGEDGYGYGAVVIDDGVPARTWPELWVISNPPPL